MNFHKLLLISIPRDGENGAGAGAGGAGAGAGGGAAGSGAGAGGAGAGAGSGAGGAGAGAGAGGGAGAGAGAGAGGGAGAGAGAGGGAAEPFYQSWGLDEAGVKFVNDRAFTDPKTLVKSAIEADTMARSRNVIDKPDPKKPGEWKGFTELGWVEDATKYGVTPPKPDAAKGEVFDPQMHRDFVAAAHELKLAPWQAEGVFNKMFGTMNKRMADMDAAGARATEEAQTALRGEWGTGYDAKLELGQRAFTALGLKPADGKSLQDFLGSAPSMAKMFAQIGEMLGEDKLRQGAAPAGGAQNADQLAAKRRALESDETFMAALKNERHPQHKDFMAQRNQLIEQEAAARRRAA